MSGKVYVGCGNDRREGFIHCDVRHLDGIDIVCPAWQLSRHQSDIQEIYSRHMLEHLTDKEAVATLTDWFKALAVGGSVYIVVPNLDYHIQQWLAAEWNDENYDNSKSAASHGFAGFYGWQRQCDPAVDDYETSYWDVHKSGYNQARLAFLLKRTGFSEVHTEIKNNLHLVAIAVKRSEQS